MTDPTEQFFDDLGRRGHEPMLAKASGSLRFDLKGDAGTDHWLLTVERGDIQVSREAAAAECVLRADRAVFDRIVIGEINGMAAVLRGALRVDGKLELLTLLRRLFPGSRGARERHRAAADGAWAR